MTLLIVYLLLGSLMIAAPFITFFCFLGAWIKAKADFMKEEAAAIREYRYEKPRRRNYHEKQSWW